MGELRVPCPRAELYAGARFWVFDTPQGDFSFQCDRSSRELFTLLLNTGKPFAVYITACNPHSTRVPHAENVRRTQALKDCITGKGYQFFPGLGVSESGEKTGSPCQ